MLHGGWAGLFYVLLLYGKLVHDEKSMIGSDWFHEWSEFCNPPRSAKMESLNYETSNKTKLFSTITNWRTISVKPRDYDLS